MCALGLKGFSQNTDLEFVAFTNLMQYEKTELSVGGGKLAEKITNLKIAEVS